MTLLEVLNIQICSAMTHLRELSMCPIPIGVHESTQLLVGEIMFSVARSSLLHSS